MALTNSRRYSTAEPDLKTALKAVIPAKRELFKQVKERSDEVIGEVKVANVIGGMRGLKSMLWEGSVLDPEEGIRFHGKTIKDCQKELPKGTSGTEMLPEAMFWLLLTGQVPSTNQVRAFSRELAEQSHLPQHILDLIKSFPRSMHPMTQLSIAVAALNTESKFAKAYEKGLSKADYWEPTFDDSISLLAKIPRVAALVFRPDEVDQVGTQALDASQDWSYNFAELLGKGGKENQDFHDLLRLYLALHGDHEGGNVSAHATHLVGSALSDPFLSYSAGLLGLAGPLHGLAAQEVLRWILAMQDKIGTKFTDDDVRNYLWDTLKSGRVVPGYGHGVLRKPDPRFQALMDFAATRPDVLANPVFQLVKKNSEIAPAVLTEHGKVCTFVGRYFFFPLQNILTSQTDQEPPPECGRRLRSPLLPLRLPAASILHRHLWRQPCFGTIGAAHLGPGLGLTHRATQEYQSAGIEEVISHEELD